MIPGGTTCASYGVCLEVRQTITDQEENTMRKLKLFASVLAMGVTAALVAGPALAKDIKIGIVDTYSGPPAAYTNDVRDALIMYTDKINASGGLLGNQIKVIARDDKYKADIALNEAKELILKEEVDVLMGSINSAIALATSDLCRKEKVPYMVTFAKSDNITGAKGHRYVFSVSENTAMIGKAAAWALAKKPYKTYWIAGDDYEYGHAVGGDIWANLQKLRPDVKLLGETWWKVGTPDFTPYITAMSSAKPDAVIIATGGAGCIPFMKASKATGFANTTQIFMHTSTELATLKPIGQDAPEGVLGTSNYHFYYPDTPANKQFVKEFQEKYNRLPTVGAYYGYLAAAFVKDAYLKAGKVDKEAFIDALEGIKVNGPLGEVEMRAYDHQAMLAMFMGSTKKSADYPFLVATDVVTVPGSESMPSVEDVKKAREKAAQ